MNFYFNLELLLIGSHNIFEVEMFLWQGALRPHASGSTWLLTFPGALGPINLVTTVPFFIILFCLRQDGYWNVLAVIQFSNWDLSFYRTSVLVLSYCITLSSLKLSLQICFRWVSMNTSDISHGLLTTQNQWLLDMRVRINVCTLHTDPCCSRIVFSSRFNRFCQNTGNFSGLCCLYLVKASINCPEKNKADDLTSKPKPKDWTF